LLERPFVKRPNASPSVSVKFADFGGTMPKHNPAALIPHMQNGNLDIVLRRSGYDVSVIESKFIEKRHDTFVFEVVAQNPDTSRNTGLVMIWHDGTTYHAEYGIKEQA
jgi:hypothetical protein